MNVKSLKKQGGIGLLELMLSLAIIAVLLVMATRYYESAQTGERVNDVVSIFQAMRASAANYSAGSPNYNDVTFQALIDSGLVPKSLQGTNGDGAAVGPWGGKLNVVGSNNTLTVSLTGGSVPAKVCQGILTKRLDKYGAVSCAGGISIQFS